MERYSEVGGYRRRLVVEAIRCEVCGAEATRRRAAGRARARYCSAGCRTRAWRLAHPERAAEQNRAAQQRRRAGAAGGSGA